MTKKYLDDLTYQMLPNFTLHFHPVDLKSYVYFYVPYCVYVVKRSRIC
jgi:hypothetical protein